MSDPEETLKRIISVDGPLRFDAYAGFCLGLPETGYYRHARAIGSAGDFITAPEISQIFGEMAGLWLIRQWIGLGEPPEFTLLELGPGKGTLLKDALRLACRVRPDFVKAAGLLLFEQNETLRQQQQQALCAYAPAWLDDLAGVPTAVPVLCLANEFFDALPVRIFHRAATGVSDSNGFGPNRSDQNWSELYVALDSERNFMFSRTRVAPSLMPVLPGIPEQSPQDKPLWYELPQLGAHMFRTLTQTVAGSKGAFLVIDYGDLAQDLHALSVQGVRDHEKVSVFERPGRTDLSAHVDFGIFAKIAVDQGYSVSFGTQRDFLLMSGAAERLRHLSGQATEAQKRTLEAGYDRLTQASQMGDLFKVLTCSLI